MEGQENENGRERINVTEEMTAETEQHYTVSIESLQKEFSLETLYMPDPDKVVDRDGKKIPIGLIGAADVSRPGLALDGFFAHFRQERIQIIGNTENSFIMSFEPEEREKRIRDFMSRRPVLVIFTRGLPVCEEFVSEAKRFGVPLMRTERETSEFMGALIASLNVSLAPRITRHGVLVEVYGEGLLILGDSGIGKSETAIELVKRGHRLVADDAVEIKKVSSITLVGSAPSLIKHYIELRGIGIVDVRRIFGMGAVKSTEKIDLVIKLEPWEMGKMYDRLGLDTEYIDIMGIKIPMTTIPVHPGRNLAVILEIAAMNNRQKKMGYNTAAEFEKMLMGEMQDGEQK